MGVPHVASILAAVALLTGCAAPSTPRGGEAPAGDRFEEWEMEDSAVESPSAPAFSDHAGNPGDSFRIGAWGWQRGVKGEVEGARGDLDEDGSTYPAGLQFEWRSVRKDPEADRWFCVGVLAEHFQDDEDSSFPGGTLETKARMTGVHLPVGFAFDPLDASGEGAPEEFRWRFDAIPGLRVSSLKVQAQNPSGGRLSESESWLEAALGLRGEYTPVQGVTLLARADYGKGLSFTSKSASWEALIGLRLQPVEHASVVIGWRAAHLETQAISHLFIWNLSGRKTEFDASGPWIGLEVDF